MSVGSLQDIFREGMRQLFVKSARFNADGSKTASWETGREFVVVSHSLGSYLVFSTLNLGETPASADAQAGSAEEDAAARHILERTSLVYFFANQVPLLELAGIEKPSGSVAPQAAATLSAHMLKWKELRQAFAGGNKPPQIVAWSDPSDLLPSAFPGLNGLIIDNLFVRNTWWHWLLVKKSLKRARQLRHQPHGASHHDESQNRGKITYRNT